MAELRATSFLLPIAYPELPAPSGPILDLHADDNNRDDRLQGHGPTAHPLRRHLLRGTVLPHHLDHLLH